MSNGGRPQTIPEFVAYANGGAFAQPLAPSLEIMFQEKVTYPPKDRMVAFTEVHRAVLRRARFLLDPAERGAPVLDPVRPFGSAIPWYDLGEVSGLKTWEDLGTLYCEVQAALLVLFEYGTMRPGRYRIANIALRELTRITSKPESSLDDRLRRIGVDEWGGFEFTPNHLALIRSANWRSDAWDWTIGRESKIWPIVFIDAKRPYTDESIARYSGWTLPTNEEGHPELSEAQVELIWEIHKQMHPACQVFVENAELPPGTYRVT